MKQTTEHFVGGGAGELLPSYYATERQECSVAIRIAERKTLGATDRTDTSQLGWTSINESSAPEHVREVWRVSFTHHHLAKFLSLCSTELRPGAELPHEFVTPSDGSPGPHSRAMKRCIDRGELRIVVLHRTTVPYLLRTVEDVEAGLTLATEIEVEGEGRPGALLQLLDCKSVPLTTRGDNDILYGAFDLFWSIHLHSIVVGFAAHTSRDKTCVRQNLCCVVGVPSSFVACTLQKRTCHRWAKFTEPILNIQLE